MLPFLRAPQGLVARSPLATLVDHGLAMSILGKYGSWREDWLGWLDLVYRQAEAEEESEAAEGLAPELHQYLVQLQVQLQTLQHPDSRPMKTQQILLTQLQNVLRQPAVFHKMTPAVLREIVRVPVERDVRTSEEREIPLARIRPFGVGVGEGQTPFEREEVELRYAPRETGGSERSVSESAGATQLSRHVMPSASLGTGNVSSEGMPSANIETGNVSRNVKPSVSLGTWYASRGMMPPAGLRIGNVPKGTLPSARRGTAGRQDSGPEGIREAGARGREVAPQGTRVPGRGVFTAYMSTVSITQRLSLTPASAERAVQMMTFLQDKQAGAETAASFDSVGAGLDIQPLVFRAELPSADAFDLSEVASSGFDAARTERGGRGVVPSSERAGSADAGEPIAPAPRRPVQTAWFSPVAHGVQALWMNLASRGAQVPMGGEVRNDAQLILWNAIMRGTEVQEGSGQGGDWAGHLVSANIHAQSVLQLANSAGQLPWRFSAYDRAHAPWLNPATFIGARTLLMGFATGGAPASLLFQASSGARTPWLNSANGGVQPPLIFLANGVVRNTWLNPANGVVQAAENSTQSPSAAQVGSSTTWWNPADGSAPTSGVLQVNGGGRTTWWNPADGSAPTSGVLRENEGTRTTWWNPANGSAPTARMLQANGGVPSRWSSVIGNAPTALIFRAIEEARPLWWNPANGNAPASWMPRANRGVPSWTSPAFGNAPAMLTPQANEGARTTWWNQTNGSASTTRMLQAKEDARISWWHPASNRVPTPWLLQTNGGRLTPWGVGVQTFGDWPTLWSDSPISFVHRASQVADTSSVQEIHQAQHTRTHLTNGDLRTFWLNPDINSGQSAWAGLPNGIVPTPWSPFADGSVQALEQARPVFGSLSALLMLSGLGQRQTLSMNSYLTARSHGQLLLHANADSQSASHFDLSHEPTQPRTVSQLQGSTAAEMSQVSGWLNPSRLRVSELAGITSEVWANDPSQIFYALQTQGVTQDVNSGAEGSLVANKSEAVQSIRNAERVSYDRQSWVPTALRTSQTPLVKNLREGMTFIRVLAQSILNMQTSPQPVPTNNAAGETPTPQSSNVVGAVALLPNTAGTPTSWSTNAIRTVQALQLLLTKSAGGTLAPWSTNATGTQQALQLLLAPNAGGAQAPWSTNSTGSEQVLR
ncbi:hypothetical protein, partial [Tumebacillus flagellatus]|uniref:hypothetical protein n=1 Tax=Tumebacillus flagellatus TaxID=1157490 RepID=UPI0005718CF9